MNALFIEMNLERSLFNHARVPSFGMVEPKTSSLSFHVPFHLTWRAFSPFVNSPKPIVG